MGLGIRLIPCHGAGKKPKKISLVFGHTLVLGREANFIMFSLVNITDSAQ